MDGESLNPFVNKQNKYEVSFETDTSATVACSKAKIN